MKLEETRDLVVRQREVLGSNPRCGDFFSCTVHWDQIVETHLITWHCCTCCSPANERLDFEDDSAPTLLLCCGWIVDQDQSLLGKEKNHLGRRVQSTQVSLYRLLWGEYYVHRVCLTGCPSAVFPKLFELTDHKKFYKILPHHKI